MALVLAVTVLVLFPIVALVLAVTVLVLFPIMALVLASAISQLLPVLVALAFIALHVTIRRALRVIIMIVTAAADLKGGRGSVDGGDAHERNRGEDSSELHDDAFLN